jgi:sulfur carrier protein ThiS adenylyltransferase
MNRDKLRRITDLLSQKTIGIAGVGGLGSNAAVALARSGIGHLIIVDHDCVEESNLNRQYYFKDQIGESKVEALKENIHRIDPEVKVTAHKRRLCVGAMHEPFQHADVIIEALDEALTKKQFIEEILEKLSEIPLIGASGVAGYGHSDRVLTRHLGNLYLCYDEQAPSSDDDVLLAPKVGLMAHWQANIAIDLLIGDRL